MIIYFSGSMYDGVHPEDIVSRPNIMMSYWEVRDNKVKQKDRFLSLRRERKEGRHDPRRTSEAN